MNFDIQTDLKEKEKKLFHLIKYLPLIFDDQTDLNKKKKIILFNKILTLDF